MRIAIVGAGRVGATLGRRWAEAGHVVTYVVRDPGRHESLTGHATVTTGPAAPDDAEVVVLAVPGTVAEAVCRDLRPPAGAIVVDATNPLGPEMRELDRDPRQSGGERVAGLLPVARVVKAFNTTGAGNMADPRYGASRPWMPVAGDDREATATVVGLARDLGFDADVAGPLAAARDLEHLAALWIRLAHTLGHGPDIAFALLRRPTDG